MKEKGVKKVAAVTSIGAGDSEQQAPFFFKVRLTVVRWPPGAPRVWGTIVALCLVFQAFCLFSRVGLQRRRHVLL